MTGATHLSPDEFRKHGYQAVDWVARYLAEVERYPVLSPAGPGDLRAALPEHPPERGEDFGAILNDLDPVILPGITHWQSPGFFAFFNGNTSPPAILGELLAAALGVQGMMWLTSPAATELETHALDWLAEMLALPDAFRSTSTGGGVIQDTASSSTFTAVVAARERATGYHGNEEGVPAGLTAYASTQAHSSIEKAIRLAGLGSANLRHIDVGVDYAMRPEALAAAIDADAAAGMTPTFVNATVGTTSSLAMDPIRAIGEICRSRGVWLHVDAAWAGTAALCPEHRHLQDGLDFADSYVVNPHKWMLAGVDCSAFYVADRDALIRSMSITPEYLHNEASASGAVIDYRDWHVAMGRRFRALKLWFVIRSYGVEGLRAMVREHVRLGGLFADWVREDPAFVLAAPVPLNLVCFRHVDGDETTESIMHRVNASGEVYLSHTRLDGAFTLRLNVGQAYTEERHVRRAWELIREAGP